MKVGRRGLVKKNVRARFLKSRVSKIIVRRYAKLYQQNVNSTDLVVFCGRPFLNLFPRTFNIIDKQRFGRNIRFLWNIGGKCSISFYSKLFYFKYFNRIRYIHRKRSKLHNAYKRFRILNLGILWNFEQFLLKTRIRSVRAYRGLYFNYLTDTGRNFMLQKYLINIKI